MVADNDQVLFQQMKNNQEAGFRALFLKYSMPLRTAAYFRLKDLQLAEDVVQEFFLALWEKRHRINIDRSVKYFFYQSVRNRCNDVLDKREVYSRKTREYAAAGEAYIHPLLPEYLQAPLYKNVSYYMSALPPQASRVFHMIVIENKKKSEVAAQMAVSINTVKSQLTRAISILRKRFGGDGIQ
ncbi:sigma-70 family RNA polymerase sigma factor [uncultured Chitinophaga sp.]|jgi:RNA polymerase sigma factor, sigma-70 family|uniref:RNA polymerase sigma factor n=1 Tax=uncultured Chitinophaga sp. TaxID=339340 RepID=UPI00260FEEB5|nr:sigma-70 family RNA polymerase sigma factor [uncultured Chitinophaga sp.]